MVDHVRLFFYFYRTRIFAAVMNDTPLPPIVTEDELRASASKYFELKLQIQVCIEQAKSLNQIMSEEEQRLVEWMRATDNHVLNVAADRVIHLKSKHRVPKPSLKEMHEEAVKLIPAHQYKIIEKTVRDKCAMKKDVKEIFFLEAQAMVYKKI